jgi:hypothetical protein
MLGSIRQTGEIPIFRPAFRALGPSAFEGAGGRKPGAQESQLPKRLPASAAILPPWIKRGSTLAG